jgi:hypothetical protein
MNQATEIYSREFDSIFFSLPPSLRDRLETRIREMGRHHAGIVLIQQGRFSVGEQMRRLVRLAAARSAEDMHDHVEFLSAWG